MGIRLLYSLKTADQGYLNIFYPTKRFKEEAQKAGIDYQALIVPPAFDRDSILGFCRGHTILLRGDIEAEYYTELEKIGCPVINPLTAVLLARDKLGSADFFTREGFRHPRTTAIEPQGKPHMDFPFIVKPRYGKMGIGVALINNPEQYSAYAHPGEILAQEYIESSMGRDIRFFFASFDGGSFVCVQRTGGGLLSNVHSGARTSLFEPDRKLVRTAKDIFRKSGLLYGTVDFLFGTGDTFPVCEMNSCPGFEGLEEATGINVARAILQTANGMEPSRHA